LSSEARYIGESFHCRTGSAVPGLPYRVDLADGESGALLGRVTPKTRVWSGRARINAMRHRLSKSDYTGKDHQVSTGRIR
jgi:hypothetical protein